MFVDFAACHNNAINTVQDLSDDVTGLEADVIDAQGQIGTLDQPLSAIAFIP